MQKWLARASFSFLIIAAVLAWEAYKMLRSPAPVQTSRLTLYCIGVGTCVALGMAGVRHRHRD